MKQILNVVTATSVFVILSMTSCKKCHECHYDSVDGEIEIGEYCGDDLEALEENGYMVGDTVYTAHCEEH